MSRYYKTSRSAPIVDYVPDYPFEELFKATKYKNDLQDTRVEKLNQAYDDVLGLNFIPGTTDENGVYQPSPSELYVKQKRQDAEDLINKYSNVDLTKSVWGNINRDITTITNDPNLADIQTSYNNYIKNIAHQRELDKAGRLPQNPWGPAGDPTKQMWDVQTQGVYPFNPVAGYDDPSVLLERYYKDMNVDERLDPSTGLILKDVTKEDISRVAAGMDETFMNTPAGKDAIADYRMNNDGAPNMTDTDIARQIIYDYGQKYLGRDIQGGAKSNTNINNKNNNTTVLDDLDRAFLPGTAWATSNETTTTPEIMNKIATNLGDGIYTLESGTKVYLNPVQIKRDGSTNDIISAHNISVAKSFMDTYGDKIKELQWEYGIWEDGEFVGWRNLGGDLDAIRRQRGIGEDWMSSDERSTYNKKKKYWKTILKNYDKDGDGKITEADYNILTNNGKNSKFSSFKAWQTNQKLITHDPEWYKNWVTSENKQKASPGGVWNVISKTEIEERDRLQNEIDVAVADYVTKYGVDVMNPELQEMLKNYQAGTKKDMEDLDLDKDDMHALMAVELSELAGSGGVWMHIPNAPTKTMVIGQEGGMPVTGKFVQGNMLFTEAQLDEYFQRKGYDQASDWFGDWDDEFVGENSRYNMFSVYTPSPASELYVDKDNNGEADVNYFQLNGAWRQVNDDWAVANNINEGFYGVGKAGNQERLLQQELYNQTRNANRNDAIFGQAIFQNQTRNFINAKRLYSDNMPSGTVNHRKKIANNINDFIESEINSGDADRIDAANRLETYLVDNDLWENGYSTNGTFGTGSFKKKPIYDTDEIPEGIMPWEYEDNKDAMLGAQFVDLFNTPIDSEEKRNLIYEHIAPWGGGGFYNGVQYIKDNKFINTEASINAYKTVASKRAESLGLNKVSENLYSDLRFLESVYAPYVTNTTKAVMVSINDIAKSLGEEFVITGLYRTPEYNKTVGGQHGSTHTKGMGIDVRLNEKFSDWLNTSPAAKKTKDTSLGPKYTVYSMTGQPIFTVLVEDDHFHIESFK